MSATGVTYETRGPIWNRKVIYTITFDNGPDKYVVVRTTDAAYDPEAAKALIQARREDDEAKAEVEGWLVNTEAIAVPNHAARPRYLSTWRSRYKEAIKEEYRRLGYKMHREILAGTFTNPQMNNAWNMTDPERNAFLGRVETAHDNWATLQNEVGE